MKTIKHLFTTLLLLCTTVASAHDFEVEGIYYTITDATNKTVEVTYRGSYYNSYDNEYTGSVVIPESVTYDGTTYSVTSIGEIAFRGCTGLTSITIPNSVTSIEHDAFAYCTGLTSITIPNSVTSIENYAFLGCKELTSITIPNSVTSIGNHTFDGCTELTSITIPNSVTSIGNYAFLGCTGLTSITIPNSVTSIGNDAFNGCTGLTSITIPNSVTSIESYAFYYCTGLTSVVIPNSVTSIEDYAFYYCSGLTSIEIPNSVTSIGKRAFRGCSGLASIVISNSVTSIGNYAFEDCTGLKTVINFSNLTFSKGSSSNGYVAYYADKVYNACNGSIEGDFIFGKPNDVNTLLYYLGNAKEITLPADYNGENYVIGNDAFNGCSGLTSIEIPDSVTRIGEAAFAGCSNLKKLKIPGNVKSIENHAFDKCGMLNHIVFEAGNDTLHIGYRYSYNEGLFEQCKIDTLLLNRNIKFRNQNYGAFNSNNASKRLKFVEIGDSVTYIPDELFRGCQNIVNLKIGKNISFIGKNAFRSCSGLENLQIGHSKTTKCTIGEYAFADCKDLKTVHINNAVIEHGAFYDCISLDKLTLNDEVTTIESYAFYGCTSLEELNTGNGVRAVEDNAFSGCTGLKEIILGKRLNYIGNGVFGNCENIETIYALPKRAINCNESNPTNVFSDKVYKYATLLVKEDAIDSYDTTEPWSKFYIEPIGDFTLTYMVDGEVYKKEKYEYDSEITPLALPEKEGHTFSGWSEIPETMPAEDITVTGSFSVNSYNVTFVVDGEVYKTVPVNYGEAITLPEEPSKEGHTFCGWSEIPETMPAQDVVIEGSFVVNSYNLIYIVDGEEYKRESVAYGTAITLSEEPTNEGYTFSGWSEVPATMPAQDITVVGSFSVNSYNATFVIDGEVYKTVPVNYGEAITLPEEPSKEGHTFCGWSEIPETMPAQDVVIEGSFAANSYYVIYIVDGEEYKRESVVYGTAITLPGEPTKEGHTFSGWSEIPETMPAEDITVTGSFSVNSYDVTFVVDGEVYQTVSVNYGETITLPEEPTKEGHTFSGWSEIPATMPAEDITITGSFYANYYTLTYMVDGEVYATVTVGYNAVIPEMEEPTKEGHTFSGWENVPETMPAQDITIIGSFTVNSYNAIFLVDNALYAMLSVNYGEAIELPEPPSKEGFVFDGWDGLPESMPAEDIVLIAIFTDITGIDDVKSEIGKVKTVYDLNGRVVENPKNGIYIINGKKVFVK